MVIISNMISNGGFHLLALRVFSNSSGEFLFTHSFSFVLMFLLTRAKQSTCFANVSLFTIVTRDFIDTLRDVVNVDLIFGVD